MSSSSPKKRKADPVTRLRRRVKKLKAKIQKLEEPTDVAPAAWKRARHELADGVGEDDPLESNVCSGCGEDVVDDGLCLFDARDGCFIPAYMAEYDYFCDLNCLADHLKRAAADEAGPRADE